MNKKKEKEILENIQDAVRPFLESYEKGLRLMEDRIRAENLEIRSKTLLKENKKEIENYFKTWIDGSCLKAAAVIEIRKLFYRDDWKTEDWATEEFLKEWKRLKGEKNE